MDIQFLSQHIMKKVLVIIGLLFIIGCDDREPENIQKAYVTLQGSDQVAVVDISAGKLIHTVDVDLTNISDMPHYVVIDERNHYWYCSLIASGYILKFDLQTDVLLDSIYIGNMPALMALDEQNGYLYVSRFMPMMGISTESQLIHKIETQDMVVVGTVNVGADSPHGIALSRDGATLWVASNQASHFFKIETSRFNEIDYQPQNFPIGSNVPSSYEINDGFYNAIELELNHDDSKLYISCSSAMEVRVFSTMTGDSLNRIMTDKMPWHMQLSHDDTQLYVTNRISNTVSVVDLSSGATKSILGDDSINMLHGCALTADDELLVVTSPGSNNIYVVATENNTILHTIGLGGVAENPMPTGAAVVQVQN